MRIAGYSRLAIVGVCLTLTALALFLAAPRSTRAVQSPRISLDMDPAGNNYDPATNTMTVGTVDGCLASPQANSSTHTHTAQLVIQNVEDLIGWQARLNYNGDEMRPTNIDFDPFLDTTTGQEVSFDNLPKDNATGKHREIVAGSSLPPGGPYPQTALIGAAYVRTQDFAISPDTPPKKPPDDPSYGAPNGGVLASVDFEVEGDQTGRTLSMQVDDGIPNPPGSAITVFMDEGLILSDYFSEGELASGFHAEGAAACSPMPLPTNPPGSARNADVAVTGLEMAAPESVEAGKYSDLHITATIQNRGPDEVEVSYGGEMRYGKDCTGPLQSGDGSEPVPADTEIRKEVSVSFACAGSADGARSVGIRAIVTAHGPYGTQDPNPFDNGRTAQVTVTVIGTAPLPTPTSPVPTPAPYGVADLQIMGASVSAPASAPAGQGFDVMVNMDIRNEGPDTTPLVVSSTVLVVAEGECVRLDYYPNVVELGDIGAQSERHYTTGAKLACTGGSDGSSAATIDISLGASGWAEDPNPQNNSWNGQVAVNILGTAPLPTLAPIDGTPIDPSQVPDSTPSNPGVGGSSSSGTPEGGVSPAVAQANIRTPAAAVLSAAAFPQTGQPAGESGPNWMLLAVAGVVLGLTAATAIAVRRLISRRA